MLAALGVAAVNVLAAAVCIMWKSGKLKGGSYSAVTPSLPLT